MGAPKRLSTLAEREWCPKFADLSSDAESTTDPRREAEVSRLVRRPDPAVRVHVAGGHQGGLGSVLLPLGKEGPRPPQRGMWDVCVVRSR